MSPTGGLRLTPDPPYKYLEFRHFIYDQSSAYTYAVELSVDQALSAGATQVQFNQPLPLYVENFLGFPVGGSVPVGWYDRTRGVWVPANNGRVVRILAVSNGLAQVDLDGSGQAAAEPALAALGITDAERAYLGAQYPVGQSLWRVPITHLTPWDCNWPYAPPADAEPPQQPPPLPPWLEDDPCEQGGSVIECQNQVLGEQVPLTGTPWHLHYRSDRTPGHRVDRSLDIPLGGAQVPASLKRIEIAIQIAGRRWTEQVAAAPAQRYRLTWDGHYPGQLPPSVRALWEHAAEQ